jgi:hypothetical protein
MLESKARQGRVVISLIGLAAMVALSSAAFAQSTDVEVPKYDIFLGYQWIHPGGTTPTPSEPGYSAAAPFGSALPDSPNGFGAAVARNFSKYLALELDYGKNWTTNGKGMNEQELSLGPRLMFRTTDANFFMHAMISWNQLGAPELYRDNNIGAILGGGIDVPITKRFTLRPIAADYVWARHNYSDAVDPEFGDLRRPTLEGVRLRSGIVLNFDYR